MNSSEYIKNLLDSYTLLYEQLDTDELLQRLASRINDFKQSKTTVISLVGGVASGKTTIAKGLIKRLPRSNFITTDDYVIGDRAHRRERIVAKNKNPLEKYDLDLFQQKVAQIKKLGEGESVRVPVYDSHTGIAVAVGEENFPKQIEQSDYLIIEGDFLFYPESDLIIYLHVPDIIRTQHRIDRDTQTRNESDIAKLKQDIETRDQQQHFPFTLPVAQKADMLVILESKIPAYKYSLYQAQK